MENSIVDQVFTSSSDGISLEVNNLNVDCITSKNNNFSIDSLGNISANSITLESGNIIDYNELFDKIYPIGSIYISVNNVNPGTIFTGTWVEFANGRTLVGVDSSQSEFNAVQKVGGEKMHQLTDAEMPRHGHGWPYYDPNCLSDEINDIISQSAYGGWNRNYRNIGVGEYKGNNQSHNNLQPYITCYIWKRTK